MHFVFVACENNTELTTSVFSNKLEKGTLRYLQAKQLAEVLGYEIVWKKRRDD